MATISQLKAQIAALNQKIATLEATVASQAATLAARDAEIAALKAEIVVLKARIAELEGIEPPPPPPPPPPITGWPDASNTGVTPGTILKASTSLAVRTAGQVISGLDVTGVIEILAPDVVLRNCRITGLNFWAIMIAAQRFTMEDCEVLSRGTNASVKGIYFDRPDCSGVVRRCNVHTVEDGIFISGDGVLAEDNYIHDFYSNGPDPHFDGIQIVGDEARNVTVRHNLVSLKKEDNSCITTGAVQNVRIENNRLLGGLYTVRIDGRFGSSVTSGIEIMNNRFGPHLYGYKDFERCTPVWSGNVDDATGLPI